MTVSDRVSGRAQFAAKQIRENAGVNVNDTNLQNFVTNTGARSHITFGDVRRLQRDCLPAGITTREEAEVLIGLNARLGRADKAWVQWLVSAISKFAAGRERHGVAADAGTVEWLERQLRPGTMSTSVGRRVARELRREVARLQADPAPPEADDTACATPPDDPCAAVRLHRASTQRRRRRTASAVARLQKIIKSDAGRSAPRPDRGTSPSTPAPPMLWSAGMGEKHLRFQLAAPCA